MKYKKYFIKIINKGDNQVSQLLESRLSKQGKSLGDFREIKRAVELLFPKIEIRILSSEAARKPIVRAL